MGLLAIFPGKRHKFESYNYFVNRQRWEDIQDLFLKESFQLFHLPRTPLLENMVHVGLSSMKTVFCGENQQSSELPQRKHLDDQCPVCDLKDLAHQLKYALKTQTSVMCKVSGKIMND